MRVKWRRLFAVCFVLMVIGALVVWRLTRTPPHWYAPPNANDAAVVDLADQVEYRLLEEFQKIRDTPEPWRLRIREEQINAWLATRLMDWIAHHEDLTWPEDLDLPQIRFQPDGISLAVSIEALGGNTVVVTRVMPHFDGGDLFVELDHYSVGRLSLPGESTNHLAKLIDRYAGSTAMDDPGAQLLVRLFKGEERIDPVLTLADSRRVRLTNLQLESGSVVLTAHTLPPGDS